VGPRACREGSGGGKVELARGLRHETSLKMKREEKGWRVDGKAAGDYSFITLPEGSAWQMEGAPTPYQTRRAVRAATGLLDRTA
jgi:hypothetical protein